MRRTAGRSARVRSRDDSASCVSIVGAPVYLSTCLPTYLLTCLPDTPFTSVVARDMEGCSAMTRVACIARRRVRGPQYVGSVRTGAGGMSMGESARRARGERMLAGRLAEQDSL